MTIYIDDGEVVKIYPVKNKVAKAVMTLLETDNELVWSTTHKGYGVEIVDKAESEEWMIKEIELIEKDNIVKRLEGFVKEFCKDDVEKHTDLIEGVNYAIAVISVTKPKAKILKR